MTLEDYHFEYSNFSNWIASCDEDATSDEVMIKRKFLIKTLAAACVGLKDGESENYIQIRNHFLSYTRDVLWEKFKHPDFNPDGIPF